MSSARTGILAALAVPLLAIGGLVSFTLLSAGEPPPVIAGGCAPAGAVQGVLDDSAQAIPAGGVTYRGEQLANAVEVIRAGADAGVGARGQTIGVMTAIGESSLINVDRGDAVGPDSRGLFQQRANGAWGTYEQRMDPYTAATSFYTALKRVPGWETLEPTIAAHRTQRNADPYHYERFWDDAVDLVAALSGGEVDLDAVCTPAPSIVPVGAGGWTKPTDSRVTSEYGMRWGSPHNGMDFGGPAGAPVRAAAAGTVVGVCKNNRSPCSGYGTLITIDHGNGEVTRYAHAYNEGVLVRVGDVVQGGQQIAEVGNYGDSTGPHLHFEVQQRGGFTNPRPFLAARGVVL